LPSRCCTNRHWSSRTRPAQTTTSAKGWLTIASETPAVGCWLDGSVEVRRDGAAVPDVEVGVSLVYGGEVVAGDRGVTRGGRLRLVRHRHQRGARRRRGLD
jgi:hypothetical protein